MNAGALIAATLVVCAVPCAVFASEGGALSVQPFSGEYAVGERFNVNIFASSGTSSISAVEAELSFNPSVLAVEHIATEGSIVSAWSTPVDFSNTTGSLEFSGWTRDRFRGRDGLILTVTFKALATGDSALTFSSGALLAPEGQTTNALDSMKSGAYRIVPRLEAPRTTPDRPEILPHTDSPEAPGTSTEARISSSTPSLDTLPVQTTVPTENAQAAAVGLAAKDTWWSFVLIGFGSILGLFVGYALRAITSRK